MPADHDAVATALVAAGQAGLGEARPTPRTSLKVADRIRVWVRAGGMCVLCNTYLLDGPLTGEAVSLGELAHIVGQQQNGASPRGMSSLPRSDRDTADNVLLACPNCHSEIDKQLVARILDVETLRLRKAAHEQRIRHVTTLADDSRTLVLRVVGAVRGNPVEVTSTTVARTVTESRRFPWYDLDRDRTGVEIDLRSLPGEVDADSTYYATARRTIDEVLAHRLTDAVRSGVVRHVSVFAFARLPILIYLGSRLEDNIAVEIYQRHRDTQEWSWRPESAAHEFRLGAIPDLRDAADAVLILNVSGTIDVEQLPDACRVMPRFVIEPDVTPSPDVMRSRSTLDRFGATIRQLNAVLDANKWVRRLHVFGALPPTAAVEFGRLHDSHIHPSVVVYDRTSDNAYRPVMEIR